MTAGFTRHVSDVREVRTGDGRSLRVVVNGDPGGSAVVVHHGTPGGASFFPEHVDDARRQGIRLIAYDRPGYGGSAPAPGRSVADCASDVEAIVNVLEIERFAVRGISGGGPHALACAALLPARVIAVATSASTAPRAADGLDWMAGMGDVNIAEFTAAQRGRDELAPLLEGIRAEMLTGTAAGLYETLRTVLTPVDADALNGDYAAYLHEMMRGGLEDGIEGWIEDELALVNDWGFDVTEVRTPTLLWHGDHDHFVPISHGRWLANRLTNVEAHLFRQRWPPDAEHNARP
jgi:pimeloyl-ACP methyl ester carboxylesterase